MPFTLTMPKLSPTMTEGTITKWHKKVGDYVDAGDLLLEIATDKATIEHNALDAGWLKKVLCQNGAKVIVNEPLAIFTEDENESIQGYEPEAIVPKNQTKEAAQSTIKPAATKPATIKPTLMQPKPQIMPAPKPAIQPNKPIEMETRTTHKKERIIASPLAKNLARVRGIDLAQLKGSGPRGRIMSRDLDQAAASISTLKRSVEVFIPALEIEEIPLSPLRQIIAERLQYSKSTIPHFYIRQEVDVGLLVAMREEAKKLETGFTINDFIIKAIAIALRQHPTVNCGFNPDTQAVIRYPSVDICVAVTIPGGLITPIIHSADEKSLSTISQEVKLLATRAKEGKLQPEEYQGGSFTISNLGMFGVVDFQAIVNPPQAAILAIGAVLDTPIVKNGAVIAGKVLSITLSCDHRVIDGAEAAQFMQTVKRLLENPILFLVV